MTFSTKKTRGAPAPAPRPGARRAPRGAPPRPRAPARDIYETKQKPDLPPLGVQVIRVVSPIINSARNSAMTPCDRTVATQPSAGPPVTSGDIVRRFDGCGEAGLALGGGGAAQPRPRRRTLGDVPPDRLELGEHLVRVRVRVNVRVRVRVRVRLRVLGSGLRVRVRVGRAPPRTRAAARAPPPSSAP